MSGRRAVVLVLALALGFGGTAALWPAARFVWVTLHHGGL